MKHVTNETEKIGYVRQCCKEVGIKYKIASTDALSPPILKLLHGSHFTVASYDIEKLSLTQIKDLISNYSSRWAWDNGHCAITAPSIYTRCLRNVFVTLENGKPFYMEFFITAQRSPIENDLEVQKYLAQKIGKKFTYEYRLDDKHEYNTHIRLTDSSSDCNIYVDLTDRNEQAISTWYNEVFAKNFVVC